MQSESIRKGAVMLLKGIEVAARSMLALTRAHEVTANNLANAGTAGYKKDTAVFHSYLDAATTTKKNAMQTPRVEDIATIIVQGPMMKTDNPLDFAITGDGFFAVQTEDEVKYTRAGNFRLNAAGELVTAQGYQVLGQSGTISFPAGKKVQIGADGSVFVDGVEAGRIRIVGCSEDGRFVKSGENLFTIENGDEAPATGTLETGYIEQSSVNTVMEMIHLIENMRGFEAAQKVILSQDETLDKAVNDVGRV